jgi:hypothetical protein
MCTATPVEAGGIRGISLRENYRHALVFDPAVDLGSIEEEGEYQLFFNNRVRDNEFRIDELRHAILVPWWTLGITIAGPLPPVIQDAPYWRLEYEGCSVALLAEATPAPASK